MNETPFLGAYWGSRKETRRECAVRIANFLQGIAHLPHFALWYLKARSQSTARLHLEAAPDPIEALLRTNSRDIDGNAIQELGFSLSAWNGSSDTTAASLAVTCGAFSTSVKNSAVLYLPSQPPPTDATGLETLKGLLVKAIEAWEPDVAVVTSHEFISREGGGMPWEIGGWLVYRRVEGIVESTMPESSS